MLATNYHIKKNVLNLEIGRGGKSRGTNYKVIRTAELGFFNYKKGKKLVLMFKTLCFRFLTESYFFDKVQNVY